MKRKTRHNAKKEDKEMPKEDITLHRTCPKTRKTAKVRRKEREARKKSRQKKRQKQKNSPLF
jgi:hypothetical protein